MVEQLGTSGNFHHIRQPGVWRAKVRVAKSGLQMIKNNSKSPVTNYGM